MATLTANKTKSSLLKKGFLKDNSHHNYYEFHYEGKLISRTYTSHDNQDINDYLIKAMSKQCLMEKPFFIEFIKCTKSKEDYIAALKASGEIIDIPVIAPTSANVLKKRKKN